MRKGLNLRFKRINAKSEFNREGVVADDQAHIMSRFNDKCRNNGKLGHKTAE